MQTTPPGKSSPAGNVYPVRDNCPSKETPRRDPCAPEGHLARLPSVRHLDHVRGRLARGTGHIDSCDLGPILGGRRFPRCLAASGPACYGRDVPGTSHGRLGGLRGSPTFVALDNDGDSLANQLLLRVPLHVDVPGVYWFILTSLRENAFGPVNKYLNLSGGDAMVVIPLSGITLRSFTGNLSVALQVALVTGYGFWTYVLEWQGIYAIPDPTYFQTVPTVDVTGRGTGPPSALFSANLEFA